MDRVTPQTLDAARAALQTAPHLSMFPQSNLAEFGLDGDAPYAPRMWMNAAGTDVLTLTNAGMVMPFLPSGNFAAAARVLSGQALIGIIGRADWARGIEAALGLNAVATSLDQDEPQFTLDLAELVIPDGPGALVPLQDVDRATLEGWRMAYDIEALGTAPEEAEKARGEIARYIARDSHRVLVVEGAPVCLTGFNARLPDIVQIGGVYTPPGLRNRGHARRAVALHLAEAQARGVTKATLFAASDAAVRAYRALGFVPVGHWTLKLFKGPEVAHV